MNEAYEYIVKKSGIKYKDTIVLAISGGPDSMALLHLFNQIKKELDLFIICAHINHNVRAESDEEKIFLEKYCDNNGIQFEFMKIENYGDDNFHNEARTISYNYLEKIVKQYDAKFLATAHHGDDLMETILMRIARGSTLKGYSGFAVSIDKGDYKLIRPFITMTKLELGEYCKANGIKFALDKTNFDDVYTRNRYRKYVLPFFKNENKNIHYKFLKFSETLMEYSDYLEKNMKNIIKTVYKQGIINVSEFRKLDHIMQVKIINNILEKLYNDDLMIISDNHVDLIINLIKSNKANSVVHLPNNVVANKSYNEFTFILNKKQVDNYEIEINDIVNLPNGMNIDLNGESDWTSNYVIRINSKEVTLPLIVRTRRNGDKMEVKGMLGRKKVNDIFINDKIPYNDRNMWPVVTDSNDVILWIPGLKKSKFDKNIKEESDIVLRYY